MARTVIDQGRFREAIAAIDAAVRDRGYDGTPLDWAEHFGHTDVAALLRSRNADGH